METNFNFIVIHAFIQFYDEVHKINYKISVKCWVLDHSLDTIFSYDITFPVCIV